MEETLKSNEESSGDKEEGKTGKDESEVSVMYLLTKWGGPDGKIFSSRSWCTDRAKRGPCTIDQEPNIFPSSQT